VASAPRRHSDGAQGVQSRGQLGHQPGQLDSIAAPTLLLAGSESPPVLTTATHQATAAIPDARIQVLKGHAHLAHKTDPAMVAVIIRQFILS
jgi:pimeloyl-ACP methyl ester carboxylesterase